jgi:2-succinyl-6-hydroxy-2,4-cyclohexadiene-1-carboxylate synthase
MGGRMALRFAFTHPDRVSALVLESTSAGIVDDAARESRRKSDSALADSIEASGVEQFVDYWESLSLWESQKKLDPARRAALRAQRLKNSAAGLANSLRGGGAGNTYPVHEQLATLNIPALLIAGSLDHAYVEHARLMRSKIPSSRLEIIEGAGHAVHFENPDAMAAVVRRFLLDSNV